MVQDAGSRRIDLLIPLSMSDGSTTGFPSAQEGTASVPPRALRRLRPSVIAVVALSMLASVAACLWSAFGEYRDTVRTITEGRVYQSGVLAPDDLRDEVRRLGIRTVIDLREPVAEVLGERAVLAALGVKHIHLPSAQIPDDGTVRRFLEIMSDPVTYPVLIHCHHGTGRSVLMSAIYRIEYEGWDREQARLATRSALRWLLPGASFAVEAPKGEYLLKYAPRHPAVARATN
jgi:protein tyrosine phosphatase (PTP) superfamily phosphohydrolase (DUF442 family)